jgi:hypothetical protein
MRSIINAAVFGENRRFWAKNLLRSARNRCDPSEASSDECQRARLDCHRLPRRAVLYHMNTNQGKSAPVCSVKPSTAPSPFVQPLKPRTKSIWDKLPLPSTILTAPLLSQGMQIRQTHWSAISLRDWSFGISGKRLG